MRKVIVNELMSLDRVVQAPGAADEDTTGGFRHDGWRVQDMDDISRRRGLEGDVAVDSEATSTGAILATYAPAA